MERVSGHVRLVRRASGPVWYLAWRLDGRQHQRRLGPAHLERGPAPEGALTRAQAEHALRAHLAGLGATVAPRRAASFGMACDEWLRSAEHDRGLRPSTLRDYRNAVERVLLPAFGADTPLEAIDRETVDGWRRQQASDGRVSPRTINKHLVLLHGIFRDAERALGHRGNPVAGVGREPARPPREVQILDVDELVALTWHAAGPQDAMLFTVAAFTGLRLGELLALRWGDVDREARLVHVRRAFSGREEIEATGARARSVPLIDESAAALEALEQQTAHTGEDDLVFAGPAGGRLDPDNLRKRFREAVAGAGLDPRLRLQDLRHTFGTLAARALPLTEVQACMGHADIASTLVYARSDPAPDAAQRIASVLASAWAAD